MTEQPPNRPEQPRGEPEIIPPGERRQAGFRRDQSAIFITMGPDGAERVRVFRPGFLSLLALSAGVTLLVALILILFFGAVLIFVPLLIVLVGAAVLVGLWKTLWPRPR